MRKFMISILAAGSVLGLAAPASAQRAVVQWASPSYNYTPYNYGRGFNRYSFARTMQARVQRIRSDVRNMQMRRMLSYGEARSLDMQARNLERKISRSSRGGINPYEARNIENGIFKLERRVAREANDWNNRWRHHRRY